MRNKKSNRLLVRALLVILFITVIISARYGAVQLSLDDIGHALSKVLSGNRNLSLHDRIFLEIRLPRTVLCVLVGASLAIGGALMQALFRNPIVEPGLIGTSSGAAFGAALYFVLGATFRFHAGEWTLPFAACAGGLLSTTLVLLISKTKERAGNSVVSVLLTGIAVNALFMSGVGFLSYIARDPQARSITFWGLGTLSGANWHSVIIVAISTLTGLFAALRYARDLNALMLGEEEAVLLGVHVGRLKTILLAINVLMIAVATSFVGVISFVGLVVPHLLRMINGSDNRFLIRNSAIAGAILLTLADLLARMLIPPAELPIGIVTSVVGVPVFIYLLRKKNPIA